jgi:methyl coenzyme M reductase beta subunit
MSGFHIITPGAAHRALPKSCALSHGERVSCNAGTGEGSFESIECVIGHAGSTIREFAGPFTRVAQPAAEAACGFSPRLRRGLRTAESEDSAAGLDDY